MVDQDSPPVPAGYSDDLSGRIDLDISIPDLLCCVLFHACGVTALILLNTMK